MSENFESKIEKIEKLLDSLNDENLTLSDSVKLYKDGLKLVNEARAMLENAKLEIAQIGEESE
ncbi:exodeoxyribonuclease VII small subunit [Campylobacter lanienae]|uniref:exodeoxyribonuclease VII small subunit n=1 Tax=Campylobacter lanienae TaxID=75658 RepID=UPI000BB3F15C|nr:exodeoxyribonuclease VII small subunit [Campylobacter lanienae]